MKTNDEGINRRNIPVKFMDYIAQTFGYETFGDVPKKKLSEVTDTIKMRFSQTEAPIRRLYAKKAEIIKRRAGETALEFAIRVDNRDPYNDVTITQEYHVTFTPGTVPGDIMISGDTETLSLSDLKPETVKQVAAELLEQEKSKTNPYATPIFTLTKEDCERISATVNRYLLLNIAQRWGRMLLDAIPKKHAFPKGGFISEEDSFKIWMKTGDSEKLTESNGERRFWPIHETGPEQIIDRSGKTRSVPDLPIETGQQWSKEDFKRWASGQPGNQNLRKPYTGTDYSHPGSDRTVFMSTSNDGINWVDNPGNFTKEDFNFLKEKHVYRANPDNKKEFPLKAKLQFTDLPEIKISNDTPDKWPATAPPYKSPEGWEYEKAMKLRNLKSMLTIEWLEKQQTEKHALVSQRLREILAA